MDSSLCGRVPAEKLGKVEILKLFWVCDPPIGGAKSALAVHRHFTQLPNNLPQILRSFDVKH